MTNYDKFAVAKELSERLKASVSPFHTVKFCFDELLSNGFKSLKFDEEWNLEKGGKYVVKLYGSTLAVFVIGENWNGMNMRFAAAHTDFPCIKLKPSFEIKENNYVKCNIDIYGGAILNTWLDRPLSAAGRVVIKSGNIMEPEIKLIDMKKPLFMIPNLAIHMNRDVNKGVELNKQKDMLPIISTMPIEENVYNRNMNGENNCDSISIGSDRYINKSDSKNRDISYLLSEISKLLNINKEDIIDCDLFLYPVEEPMLMGIDNNLFSSGRLDNITSVQACIKAVMESNRDDGINIIMLYDSEEVGSVTKQGAGSMITRSVIERIFDKMGFEKEIFECAISKAMGISVDVAHAVHPNSPEKSDITSKLYMNKGFAIKTAVNERYASDVKVLGALVGICESEDIPYQRYVNRSDMVGGSTLGAIAVANLPIRMLDIGVPILAMHSSRETMGIYDQCFLEKAVEKFLNTV